MEVHGADRARATLERWQPDHDVAFTFASIETFGETKLGGQFPGFAPGDVLARVEAPDDDTVEFFLRRRDARYRFAVLMAPIFEQRFWAPHVKTALASPDRLNVRFASGFKTPMLVIHGERDFRVPVTQGLECNGVLKAKGLCGGGGGSRTAYDLLLSTFSPIRLAQVRQNRSNRQVEVQIRYTRTMSQFDMRGGSGLPSGERVTTPQARSAVKI